MEDVGALIFWPFGPFYVYLFNFKTVWYILIQFVIFYGNLVYISRFGILHQENSGNPASVTRPNIIS
jgi:hypothetical protein